jgi:hypothetical protein
VKWWCGAVEMPCERSPSGNGGGEVSVSPENTIPFTELLPTKSDRLKDLVRRSANDDVARYGNSCAEGDESGNWG